MTVSEFPAASRDYADARAWSRQIADVLNRLMHGKGNNVLDVTMTESATATTVSDARIGVHTVCIPEAVTAHAAALARPYVVQSSRVNGSVIFVHASDANSDLTFKITLVG